MYQMKNFNLCKQEICPNTVKKDFDSNEVVDSSINNLDLPKEMDIYCRTEEDFLPDGKSFEELTEEELKHLQLQYRFDFYRPGVYQGITGFGKMIG